MTAPAPSQLFPVVVGVSGHIDIVPDAEPSIRASVASALAELQKTYGAALHVLTGLAEGADQLVVQEARKLSIRIIAALPMPMARYAATLPSDAGRSILADFWAKAELQLQLPEICDLADADYDELHYEQLGVLLARRSHLLLALWNGDAPMVPARGGTADVIAMRAGGTHHRVAAQRSPWFRESFTRLDLSRGGPVLHIVTPRAKNGGIVAVPGQTSPQAGASFLLPKPPQAVGVGGLVASLTEDDALDFKSIATLNRRISAFRPDGAAVFARQLGYLKPDGVPDPGGKAQPHLDQLRAWQAAPDVAAQIYQRKLLDVFPALPGPSWWPGNIRLVGVIFAFTALVPLAVLLFESHVGFAHNPYWLTAYVMLFLAVILYYRLLVLPGRWQDHFQDYRALAEAMRVQLFWGLAAIPDGVADYTLRQQRGELGWINFALRGPALWAAGLAQSLPTPHRDLVTAGWIKDQGKYFVGSATKPGMAQKNARWAHRNERWSERLLYVGIGTAILMLPIEIYWHNAHLLLEVLTILAAILPAISAYFVLSAELRAYAAHSHSYALMGRLFNHALGARQASEAEFQGLVRELGREALSEHAEWLLDHRRRKIDPKAG